jgi:hypothetical protein
MSQFRPTEPGLNRRLIRVLRGCLALGLALAGYQVSQHGFGKLAVSLLVWAGIMGLLLYFAYFSASGRPSPVMRMVKVAAWIVAAMLGGGLVLYAIYSWLGVS